MGQRARIFREENKLPGIFAIIQIVNSAAKGSYEPTYEQIELWACALELSIDDWEPAQTNIERQLFAMLVEAFDVCVKMSKS